MIKNALLHASLTLNGLEKKIGFFEKFQPSKTLAIYLGHRTVDILQVEKGYLGHKTVLARSFTNPFTHFDEANPEGETSFKEELNGFLRRSDRDWDEVVLGLPRSLVTFKKVSIPAPEKNMIPDVLSFEIEKHIPFNPSDALYDYKVFGESKEKVYSVFISIIKKNIVDFYLGLLGSIGLVPTIVDISTCSILNALFFHDVDSTVLNFRKESAVIVEKNETNIEIVLLNRGQVLLSRSFFVPEEHNEQSKEEHLKFFVQEVQKTTANYALSGKETPGTLILSGLEGLKDIDLIPELEEKLSLKVLLLNETKKKPDFVPGKLAVSGLALRGIGSHPFEFNLIPKSFKTGKLDSRIITLSLMGAVLFLLPVCALSAYYSNVKKLDTVNGLLEKAKNNSQLTEELYLKNGRLKNEARAFSDLEKNSVKKLEALQELSKIFPKDIWVSSISIDKKKLEIVGFAKRASPIINMMENSPRFSDVKFDGRIVKEDQKEKFRLKAELR